MKTRVRTGLVLDGIIIGLSVIVVLIVKHNTNVNAEMKPPLEGALGNSLVLDFNTPTSTPTPSPTPTPTPSPTPSPSPTPTPFPVTSEQLDSWFTQYANHYSIDRSLLWQIAACETGLRPNATNWIYGGMFQFSPNTWKANRSLMGADTNPDLRFNPEEAIRTAAFVLSTRGPGAWPNCSKR
jgi:hypothetical protein